MKNDRKVLYSVVTLALVLSVIGITVGFASLSTELNVNGAADVVPATWKIKFDNLSNATITGAAEVVTAPVIQSDTHIGDYKVKLTKPGDQVVYTFDVVNSGTMDAELGTYEFSTPTINGTGDSASQDANIVSNNLIYKLTYADGTEVKMGDILNKNETKTLKLTIGYDTAATELPINNVTIDGMDIIFVYNQK